LKQSDTPEKPNMKISSATRKVAFVFLEDRASTLTGVCFCINKTYHYFYSLLKKNYCT